MAWRFDREVIRGELDNRQKGKITGTLWLAAQSKPVQLNLEGNPSRDWAGCVLRFTNPAPEAKGESGLALEQDGVCGDMTASHRVRIPPEPIAEWIAQGTPGIESLPWGNAVYLEWFSEINGRVVIESTRYRIEVGERAWSMTPEEERRQKLDNSAAMQQFMEQLGSALPAEADGESSAEPADEDGPAGQLGVEDRADRAQQLVQEIEDLKRRARALGGDDMVEGPTERNLPLDLQRQFWQNVVDFESAPRKIRRELLAEDGFVPSRPDNLSDEELTKELWRLIHALAARRTYLDYTNHLSDRELYTLLVEEVLEEETEVLPKHAEWNCRICIDEYGAPNEEPGTSVYLRYYADERDRASWPSDQPLPPQCDPPYDRDRRLPQ